MFWEFFSFEVKFRLKSPSTYVYFGLWFLLSFLTVAAEDFGFVRNGKVLLNGPYASFLDHVLFGMFGMIIIAAIFGTSILRDFQRDTYQLLFTKPITKFAYLGGRWAGSFVITVLVFSGLMAGEAAGTLAPWADHTRIAHGHLWWYLQPFLAISVVQIFFLGSLFFCVAALSRKIFIVYLQGVALFMVYLVFNAVFVATRSLERFWSSILDPIGTIMASNLTRYWTVAEQNNQLPPLRGVFLYNRILWLSVGVLALAVVWALFPMSVEALTRKASGRRARAARAQGGEEESAGPRRTFLTARLPQVQTSFGARTSWLQMVSLTRLRVSNILHELPFWAMAALVAGFSLINGHFAGKVNDADVWPVTYLMLQAVEGGASLFFYIVATLYAGELIWRERDTRFDGIHDALPMGEGVDGLSRLAALAFVELVLLTLTMACGVVMQTVAGYHHYEFLQYLKELYVVAFPQVMTFALLALFVHSLVPNKFMGHGIVVGVFAVTPVLYRFGLENTLYLFGATPPFTYSDMNGYGHYVQPLLWSTAYWLAIAALLGLVAMAFTRRGAEMTWPARLRVARQRLPRLLPAMAVLAIAALGSGLWYYTNAHVLNEYTTAKARRAFQAEYERNFKRFERQPLPKLVSVDATVAIHPETRSFEGQGRFTLQNKAAVPIREIHLSDTLGSVLAISFDRPFHRTFQSGRKNYAIYQLETPLEPGDRIAMDFRIAYVSRGFRDGDERPELAFNGTFFDSGFFPTLGYDPGYELDDPRRRAEAHLPPLAELPPRSDPYGSMTSLFTPHADWITFHTIVSTSADQIAVAPGYLQRRWQEGGRNHFEYTMEGTRILDFFAYQSGRYQVRTERHGGVDLQVYYDPAHPYAVDDMLAAARDGLDYFASNFSPYQFSQYRILEFPRYRTFAQSFPNTVPFSEGIGFIGRVKDQESIDYTYFVVAHELAHQWWAHQLIGGQVQGSNMLSEALAEYSALRVMAKRYGEANMRKFLKHELDGYLRGRSGELRREPPLALVQREPYVWYQKGSLVLYALSDYIGEDKVNLALRTFLLQHRYANAGDGPAVAYPDTRDFVAALRAQTPPELQYYLTDAFENIVLYDNKALTATVANTPDHRFKVTLTVQAAKLHADGNGLETPMALDDSIDIGVFEGAKGHEKPLLVRKERFTQGQRTFTLVVDRKPTRAGIDPFNKLIDRNGEDNMVDVKE